MTNTGWLKKDTNLTGKLLGAFFRANYDPQGNVGFFTSKPQGSDGKVPTVMQKTKFIGNAIRKLKEDNPELDIRTAIVWTHHQLMLTT